MPDFGARTGRNIYFFQLLLVVLEIAAASLLCWLQSLVIPLEPGDIFVWFYVLTFVLAILQSDLKYGVPHVSYFTKWLLFDMGVNAILVLVLIQLWV